MKGFGIFLILLLSSSVSFSQEDTSKLSEEEKKEEREYKKEERKRDMDFFKYQYQPKNYKKYSGNIFSDTTHGSTFIQFDSIRIYLFGYSDSDSLKDIFTSGLLSAQMIYCTLDSSCNATPEMGIYDTLGKPIIEDLWGWTGHTIEIDYFELLTDVESKPTQRRFKFWVYPYKIRVNGGNDILFLELTNEKANNNTDIETFIKGAKVTFLKRGWAMI